MRPYEKVLDPSLRYTAMVRAACVAQARISPRIAVSFAPPTQAIAKDGPHAHSNWRRTGVQERHPGRDSCRHSADEPRQR